MAKHISRLKPESEWSLRAKINARKILAYSKDVLGANNHHTHLIACQELFGIPYMDDRMKETRSYISHVASIIKERKKAKALIAFLEANLKERIQELQKTLHP